MNAPCLCLPEPDRDRGLLLSAGIAAILVHLVALIWLPLPAAPEPLPRTPRPPVFEIDRMKIPPPTPPPLPDRLDETTSGLTPPELLPGRAEPRYPPLAVKSRLTGRVVLRAVITREGRVSEIEVLEAPRYDPGFVAEAIEAVSRWRYTPGLYRGREVEVVMRVVVEFSLN